MRVLASSALILGLAVDLTGYVTLENAEDLHDLLATLDLVLLGEVALELVIAARHEGGNGHFEPLSARCDGGSLGPTVLRDQRDDRVVGLDEAPLVRLVERISDAVDETAAPSSPAHFERSEADVRRDSLVLREEARSRERPDFVVRASEHVALDAHAIRHLRVASARGSQLPSLGGRLATGNDRALRLEHEVHRRDAWQLACLLEGATGRPMTAVLRVRAAQKRERSESAAEIIAERHATMRHAELHSIGYRTHARSSARARARHLREIHAVLERGLSADGVLVEAVRDRLEQGCSPSSTRSQRHEKVIPVASGTSTRSVILSSWHSFY